MSNVVSKEQIYQLLLEMKDQLGMIKKDISELTRDVKEIKEELNTPRKT